MKLKDINEIKEDGLLVFMPSGIQARIFNEGKTILVKYYNLKEDRYTTKDFKKIIKEGIEIFSNQPTIAQQSVLMESENCLVAVCSNDDKHEETELSSIKNLEDLKKAFGDAYDYIMANEMTDENGEQYDCWEPGDYWGPEDVLILGPMYYDEEQGLSSKEDFIQYNLDYIDNTFYNGDSDTVICIYNKETGEVVLGNDEALTLGLDDIDWEDEDEDEDDMDESLLDKLHKKGFIRNSLKEAYKQEDNKPGDIYTALKDKEKAGLEYITSEFKNELLTSLDQITREYPNVKVRQQARIFMDELGLQEYYDIKAVQDFCKKYLEILNKHVNESIEDYTDPQGKIALRDAEKEFNQLVKEAADIRWQGPKFIDITGLENACPAFTCINWDDIVELIRSWGFTVYEDETEEPAIALDKNITEEQLKQMIEQDAIENGYNESLNEKYCTKADINKFLKAHKAIEVAFGRYVSEIKGTEKLFEMHAHGSKKIAGTYDSFDLSVYPKGALYREELATGFGKVTTKYYIFGKEAENITEGKEDDIQKLNRLYDKATEDLPNRTEEIYNANKNYKKLKKKIDKHYAKVESVNEEDITLPRYSVIGMNLKRNEKEGIGIVWDKDFDDPREAMKFAQEKGKEEPQHVIELIDTIKDQVLYNSQEKNESLNETTKKYRDVVADDKYTRYRDLFGTRGRKRTLHVKPTGGTLEFLSGPKKEYKDIKTGELFYLGDDSNVMTDRMGEPYTKFEIIDESLNEELEYGVEYRNMHDGIHRLLVTDSKEKAEQILAYLKELENPDTTVYDDNEIMDNAMFTWDEINKLADDCFEVDYREIEEGDGNYNGIYVINYNDIKPDIYESLKEEELINPELEQVVICGSDTWIKDQLKRAGFTEPDFKIETYYGKSRKYDGIIVTASEDDITSLAVYLDDNNYRYYPAFELLDESLNEDENSMAEEIRRGNKSGQDPKFGNWLLETSLDEKWEQLTNDMKLYLMDGIADFVQQGSLKEQDLLLEIDPESGLTKEDIQSLEMFEQEEIDYTFSSEDLQLNAYISYEIKTDLDTPKDMEESFEDKDSDLGLFIQTTGELYKKHIQDKKDVDWDALVNDGIAMYKEEIENKEFSPEEVEEAKEYLKGYFTESVNEAIKTRNIDEIPDNEKVATAWKNDDGTYKVVVFANKKGKLNDKDTDQFLDGKTFKSQKAANNYAIKKGYNVQSFGESEEEGIDDDLFRALESYADGLGCNIGEIEDKDEAYEYVCDWLGINVDYKEMADYIDACAKEIEEFMDAQDESVNEDIYLKDKEGNEVGPFQDQEAKERYIKDNGNKEYEEIIKEENMSTKNEDCYKVYNTIDPDSQPLSFNSWNEVEDHLNQAWGDYKASMAKENTEFGTDQDRANFMGNFEVAIEPIEIPVEEIPAEGIELEAEPVIEEPTDTPMEEPVEEIEIETCPECGEAECICDKEEDLEEDFEDEHIGKSEETEKPEVEEEPEITTPEEAADKVDEIEDAVDSLEDFLNTLIGDEELDDEEKAEIESLDQNEDFKDNMGMLTDINDLDFPDALADTVDTKEDGSLYKLSDLAKEIEDMKSSFEQLKNDFKSEITTLIQDLKTDLKLSVNNVETKVQDTKSAVDNLTAEEEDIEGIEFEEAPVEGEEEEAPAEEENTQEAEAEETEEDMEESFDEASLVGNPIYENIKAVLKSNKHCGGKMAIYTIAEKLREDYGLNTKVPAIYNNVSEICTKTSIKESIIELPEEQKLLKEETLGKAAKWLGGGLMSKLERQKEASKWENLEQVKQEIDKQVQQGANAEQVKDAITLSSDDENEEKQAKEYAIDKLKNQKAESLLNKLMNTSKTAQFSNLNIKG